MSKGDGMERVIAALGSRDFQHHKIWTTDYIRFPIMAGGKRVEVEVCQGMRGAVVFADKIDGSRTADALAYLGLSEVELLDDYELKSEEIARLKLKLKTLAAEASRFRAAALRSGLTLPLEKGSPQPVFKEAHYTQHASLVNAIKAAREEEEEA